MNICVIDTNDVRYNETDMMHRNFASDTINDVLEDCISFVKINSKDDLLENIVKEIVNYDNEIPIHTATIKNKNNDLFLMCHIAPSKEVYEEMKSKKVKYNGIASHMTDLKLRVYGKAVLYKLDASSEEPNLANITSDDIVELFVSNFIHKGVIVNVNGTFDECKYIFNPIDWISPNEVSTYKYHEVEFLGKILMLFFDSSSKTKNDVLTDLFDPLFGRIVIGMRSQYHDINDVDIIYEDLDVETLKNIIKLCENSGQSRALSEEEDINGKVVNGRRNYNNFHKILNSRLVHN